jgi:hypothetical protein
MGYNLEVMFQFLYLGTCLTLAAFISAKAAELPARVEVLLKFDHQPSATMVRSMQREAATIFKSAGINLNWSLWDKKNVDAESKPNLVVLRFKGRCSWSPISISSVRPFDENLTLARSSVRQGQVLPFAEIQCDQVQKLIRPLLAGPVGMGTAIGRVVAHELYHILGNTVKHGPDGLSKRSVGMFDLNCKDAEFAKHDLALIKGLQQAKDVW